MIECLEYIQDVQGCIKNMAQNLLHNKKINHNISHNVMLKDTYYGMYAVGWKNPTEPRVQFNFLFVLFTFPSASLDPPLPCHFILCHLTCYFCDPVLKLNILFAEEVYTDPYPETK